MLAIELAIRLDELMAGLSEAIGFMLDEEGYVTAFEEVDERPRGRRYRKSPPMPAPVANVKSLELTV